MRNLSKSTLIAYRQCPKRLWLEIHRPDLREDAAATQASFQAGDSVGNIARQLYDSAGDGVLLDAQRDGFASTFNRSMELLSSSQPIFEAGFSADGAMAFADAMLPDEQDDKLIWRMVEVKSSTQVKDYHRDDAAIQSFIARRAGVPLASIALAHIDSDWIYPGDADYRGLLKEFDLTSEAFGRDDEMREWITAAHDTAAKPTEPEISTGGQCGSP
ncbi:MAG: DUF2779 domain-containing protein, partial [Gallionella sp.]